LSANETELTTYLWNQSKMGVVCPGGVQRAGKQRLLLLSLLAGMTPPMAHSVGR
jgi:hypothetical protein